MITENTIGPFGVFFANRNPLMGLAGHSHFATVKLTYVGKGDDDKALAFPSFEDSHDEVRKELRRFFAEAFREHTNEDIARQLFEHFSDWRPVSRPGGNYGLIMVELAVRGVPDRIGHADGFTVYRVYD